MYEKLVASFSTTGSESPVRKVERLPAHLRFKEKFDKTLDLMESFESKYIRVIGPKKQNLTSQFARELHDGLGLRDIKEKGGIATAEDNIFTNMIKLFELKHGSERKNLRLKNGFSIGALAALGAGKTTVTRALEERLRRNGELVEFKEERHLGNPFWRRSQGKEKNNKFMLRSQAHFLLGNVLAQLEDGLKKRKNKNEIVISDTSPLTDFFDVVFMVCTYG